MSENKTAAGLFWRTLESIGTQGMQFLVQLVLARLLMPEDFGVVAILSIFVNIANTVVQSGLSSARSTISREVMATALTKPSFVIARTR